MGLQTTTGISGFIDAHVHLKSPDGLALIEEAGIVAVRDAGFRENAARKHGTPNRRQAGPVVVGAGWALYKKHGYGSLFGAPVEGRREIRSEILKLKQAGARIIKVMASGIVSLRKPGSITPGGFTGDELSYIVQESARAGLGVMAHANGEPAILAAARAGVRSIEHGFFMTRRALEAVAKAGVFWTPTVGALARVATSTAATDETKIVLEGLLRSHGEEIEQAYAIGISLVIGTDFVLPGAGYEAAYHDELAYFEKAGLSRDAVLTIACDNGARLLGLK